jgi:transposase
MNATMIGLDIAKLSFHLDGRIRGVATSQPLARQKVLPFFAKLEPSSIAIEACGTAHYWGRELEMLGHKVQLIPAAYVKPFVKRNKTDARDAAAIRVAASQEGMRFVPVKSEEQQSARALHTSRDQLVSIATQSGNSLRCQLAEFGIIAAKGHEGLEALVQLVEKGGDARTPAMLIAALKALALTWRTATEQAKALEREIVVRAKADKQARRLQKIPGIGWLTAHAMIAAVGDGLRFASARDFAAWIGLTPRTNGTGGKQWTGHITRAGDCGVRRLLVLGASAVLRVMRARPERCTEWVRGLLGRRPVKVAVVAQAAKTARIVWAVLTSGKDYDPEHASRRAGKAEVAVAA